MIFLLIADASPNTIGQYDTSSNTSEYEQPGATLTFDAMAYVCVTINSSQILM